MARHIMELKKKSVSCLIVSFENGEKSLSKIKCLQRPKTEKYDEIILLRFCVSNMYFYQQQ